MTALARARQEIDVGWRTFVAHGRPPDSIRAEIVRSWERARSEWNVDPNLRACTRSLAPEELAVRREGDDAFHDAAPVLAQFGDRLGRDGHVVAWFDAGGWMLTLQGSEVARERLAGINFAPGACWTEAATGTNGVGTALVEERPVEVFASEHYVSAWQEWSCASVPVRAAGKLVGVVDITSPWDARHPSLLLCAEAMARAIEGQLDAVAARRRESIRSALLGKTGGWLAIDLDGTIVGTGPAAAIDGCHPGTIGASALAPVLASMRGKIAKAEELEPIVEIGGRRVRVVCSPVQQEGRIVGAVLCMPAAPARGKPTPRAGRRPMYEFDDVLGGSAALRDQIAAARRAARNALPVLVLGESGTGKELFAQAIHSAGERSEGPFVALNCGCIPQSLVEPELFGYEAGSFTGGRKEGNRGRFEDADGGTLFLDEVSELSALGQTALLRVLQEREVVRIGSSVPRPVDVRIIAASNKDLLEEIRAGRFRRDLYYRLNVLSIELPPLRSRSEDVARLAEHSLALALPEIGRAGLTLAEETVAVLAAYDWPGNVRELKNVVERSAVAAAGPQILVSDLPAELQARAGRGAHRGAAFAPPGPTADPAGAAARAPAPADAERGELHRALEGSSWNVVRAARSLGISRRTLYRRLQKLGMARAAGRRSGPTAIA
jgi:sigma-54 dependent transcriptional regulator, acetoin dehydrogenase operon transcriptional activator AcoR